MTMYGPFDHLDPEDINEIAGEDGFSIDEDGHWMPMDDGLDIDIDFDDGFADFDLGDLL